MAEDIEEKDTEKEKEKLHSLVDHDTKRKPAVHYPEGTKPVPPFVFQRQESDMLSISHPASIAATDEEDSSDYDWSTEEDLVDEEAKFEKHMGIKSKPEGWGLKRIIILLFSTLVGSLFLSGILVTPALLVHFYWYKPHSSEHRRYVDDNVQAWLFWAAINLPLSWLLAMLINIVPIFVHGIISAVWGHVSEFVKSRIELYDSVRDSVKPAFYAASAYASWVIIFGGIYDLYNPSNPEQSRATYTQRVAQVVQFLFFLALIWCIQRLLSHSIAFAFHHTAYKERIEYVEEVLNVIEKLRNYRPKPLLKSGTRTPIFGILPLASPFSEKEHFNSLNSALRAATNTTHSSRLTQVHDEEEWGADADTEEGVHSNAAKGKEKRKIRLSWLGGGDAAYGKGGNPSRRPTGSTEGLEMTPTTQFSPSSQFQSPPGPHSNSPHRYPPSPRGSPRHSVDTHDGDATLVHAAKAIKNAVLHDARNIAGDGEGDGPGLAWNVSSAKEAKRLARLIYIRFKDRRRSYLLPSDFYPAFPTPDAAEKAFRVFDKDNNGDISRAEVKTTLLKVYKERRFLSRSMRDVGEALRTLDRILLFFAAIILFFISLSVFGVQVGDSLTSVYSIGIAASFIFKNSASSAFDAIMFIFVTHPYDTGDRCFIDNENLVVKKVGLFATVFARSDGSETYYFNSQLFSKFITNVRRSAKTAENLTMQVAWRTPLTKLDALEKCLNEWLSTEENRWFEPSTNIVLQHIVYQRYLEITIGIGHNGNWQDWGLRNARKTAFHAAVQYYCRQLGIIGYEAPMPIVFADQDWREYRPPVSPFDDQLSPPPSRTEGRDMGEEPMTPRKVEVEEHERLVEEAKEVENAAKDMKPTLGFLPPLAARSTQLRARKSKSRKAMLRGMDA